MERARGVLALQLVMNGVNVVLDLVFVLGFGWGVAGVAAATLIAEWSGLAVGLWLCRSAFTGAQWRDWARVFDPERLRRMAAVNRDILIRSVVLQASFTSFLFFGAGLGDVTLAANQVLLQFLAIGAYALDGFAFAAEALIGQTLGSRARGDLRRAALMTSEWGVGTALVLALAFLVLGPWLIDLMTTSPEVRAAALPPATAGRAAPPDPSRPCASPAPGAARGGASRGARRYSRGWGRRPWSGGR